MTRENQAKDYVSRRYIRENGRWREMSNIEHYFENMLFYGEDTTGNPNKNALTKEEQNAVEECASYVLYTLFYGRAHFTEVVLGNIYERKYEVEE